MKNPFVRWVIFILGGLVALLLVAAGVLFFLLSRYDAKAEIERAALQATGRQLTITGNVGVTFYPVLGLSAEGASLANVQGGRSPALVSIEKLSVGVEPWPLVQHRTIVVHEFVLEKPRIALEVDAQGRPNWILQPLPSTTPPRPGAPPTAPQAPSELTVKDVHVRNGEISYFDARQAASWTASAVTVDTAMTSLDQPVSLTGALTYAGQVVNIDARLEAPRAVIQGRDTGIDARIRSDLLTAHLTGRVAAATGGFQGDLEASGPSLRRMLAWLVAPVQAGYGLEAFTINGKLTTGSHQVAFENASLSIDAIRGRGDFVLEESRGHPYVSGRLEIFDLDINPYLAAATQPAAEAAQIAEAAAAPRRAIDVQTAPTETPFDFSGLKAINADLELTTGTLKVQQIQTQRAQMSVVLNDGYLAATIHNVQLYGGSGHGRTEIDARAPDVRIVQEFAADHLDARGFLTAAIGLTSLSGRTEVNVAVRTQGRTQSQLIAALDGRVSFELVQGTLDGVDLGGVATTIRRALNNELISPSAHTTLTGMSATFAIANGVMASDSLSFNTPDLRLRGLSVIDLPQRNLDIRLVPQGALLAIPFRVHGPWTQLGYAADLNGTALRALQPRVAAVRAASH